MNGDAGPLRLAHQMLLDEGVPPLGLVHDLQNHDEITYQFVELKERENETFTVNGKTTTGNALRDGMLREMRERLAGDAISYTMLYRSEKDGLATTFPGFIAARPRSSHGSERTHGRTGTLGRTRSTSCTASLHILRVPQLGHRPRFLHEKATSTSCPQSSQWQRRKPRATSPQPR